MTREIKYRVFNKRLKKMYKWGEFHCKNVNTEHCNPIPKEGNRLHNMLDVQEVN